jgi:hypothetical protein
LDQTFIRSPTLQCPVRTMIVVVVHLITQIVVEQVDIVRDAVLIEHLVALLVVDSM